MRCERASFLAKVGLNEGKGTARYFIQVASPSDWVVHYVVTIAIIIAKWYLVTDSKEKNGKQKADHRNYKLGTV